MKSISKNVVFLRVGIDRGAGGMAAPLFKDGSFEFVPIDAAWHKHGLTYGNTLGIKKKKPLIQYFPASRQKKMHNRAIHNDPEFETFTYGDPTLPKQGLRRLERGDLLVLYCGLRGWNKCEAPEALYIVGFFNIQIAGTYSSLVKDRGEEWVKKLFSRNHHIIHGDVNGNSYKRTNRKTGKIARFKSSLVLIKGGSGSRLLGKAVRLSAQKKQKDKGGHDVFVLDRTLSKHLGRFTKLNAIQRSIPRWVDENHAPAAAKFIRSLK